LQQTAAWFDFPIWAYRRRSPVPPKTQIINFLKAERPVIGVFVDSGGPDGQVRQGFLDVARAAEALLVPLAWHVRPALVLRLPRRRYCFPGPFSRIRAYYGQPIDGVGATQVVVVETGGRPVVVGGDVAVWFGELEEPHTEGQLRVRALDPELVWLAHEHEPWRPRTA
jgi:hypothetical protein